MITQRGSSAFHFVLVMQYFFLGLALVFSFGIQQSFAQNLTDGLVFLYNFTGEAVDSSGNGLDPIVYGASLTEDRFGNPNSAYEFDGEDDYVEIPFSSLIQIDPPVSFSLWVNVFSVHGDTMKFFLTDATHINYHGYRMNGMNTNSGQVTLTMGGGLGGTNPTNRRTKVSDIAIETNQWYHIAGVIRDYDDMDIYINCVDAGGYYSGSGPTLPAHSGSEGRIGSVLQTTWASITHYKGKIDQLAMWDRALSASDIIKICSGQLEESVSSILDRDRQITQFTSIQRKMN